jgi:hypothetical protein
MQNCCGCCVLLLYLCLLAWSSIVDGNLYLEEETLLYLVLIINSLVLDRGAGRHMWDIPLSLALKEINVSVAQRVFRHERCTNALKYS